MRSHVYLFGSGDCGQLGLGEKTELAAKPKLHPFFDDKQIVAIAAGGLHSLALSSTGRVYSWGCNDEKALGHRAAEFCVGQVEGLEGQHVVQVAAGDSISAALTSDGRIFTWGTFRDSKGVLGHSTEGSLLQERPTLLQSLESHRVVQIAAGSNHLMAVTDDGQLFSWGCGEQGQLGRRILERHKMLALRPANVTPRMGRGKVRVRKVICGSYHTLLIADYAISPSSPTPALFAMGLNNFGQLGVGHHQDLPTADLVDPHHWNGTVPVDAAAGEHHSIVLCANGQIYTFGRADSGQLGVPLPDNQRASNIPIPLHTLNEPARLIAAGGNHNLTATTPADHVFSWGYGEMHQLGHGLDQVESLPRRLSTKLAGSIVQLAAGGQHSIILTHEL